MKRVLLSLAILCLSAVAQTENSKDICVKYMVCGHYESDSSWYNIDEKRERDYAEIIDIVRVTENILNIQVFIYVKGTDPKKGWTLDKNLVFKGDLGQFDMVDDDSEVTSGGFCNAGVCNVSFRPYPYGDNEDNGTMKGKVNAFTDTLRFKDGKLYRYNMVTDSESDGDYRLQKSVLFKK